MQHLKSLYFLSYIIEEVSIIFLISIAIKNLYFFFFIILNMVPLPTSDVLLLREHLFYETGNLKYVLPFVNLQNYHLGDDSNADFNFVDFILRIVLLSVILLACVTLRRVYSSFARKTLHHQPLEEIV